MNKRIKRKKAKKYFLKHEEKFQLIWNKREIWWIENIKLTKQEESFMDEVEDGMFKAMKILYKNKK